MNPPLARLLPRSLIGRVFALYAGTLVGFMAVGLGLFYQYQFSRELEATQERAQSLVEVALPAIAESAVVGDYDTIRRTLERAIRHSDFESAAFIDLKGSVLRVQSDVPLQVHSPVWLKQRVQERLFDTNLPVSAGGRDYGVLRMTLAAERVAGEWWRQARFVLALALGGLVAGLVLIRLPLKMWLGELGQLEHFDEALWSGAGGLPQTMGSNAPTEFKQTFAALNRAAASMQVQREQAAATLGAIGDGVLTLDARGQVILANPAACQMLAQDASALLGQPVREVLAPLFDGQQDGQQDGQAELHPWAGKRTHVNAWDQPTRVIDSTLSRILGPAGEPHGHVLAFRDVTEQHTLDERLRSELRSRDSAMASLRRLLEGLMPEAHGSEMALPTDNLEAISDLIAHLVQRVQERGEQLNAIFEMSPDGFVSFDEYRLVNYVSPAFSRLTGLATAQVMGLTDEQFGALLGEQCAHGAPALRDFGALRRSEAGGGTGGGASGETSSGTSGGKSGEHRRTLIDLERPTKRVLEVALRQGRSQAIAQVLHLRDVTHETEVDQLKSEFLSTAAHELRTPMASIFGFAELMMMRPMSPERQKDVIATIHRQTALMISIVNELLDLARIEARRGKDFTLEDIDLCQMAREVMHDFKPPNERDSPTATLPEGARPVRADRSKLMQAINNVLSNAYKYSPGGGEVCLSILQTDTHVGLEIRDHGIGMTPEQLARVSERFYRADASGAIPGTGLGMSIVKEIVELLGGSLGLKSVYGEGTTTTLWLPKVVAASAAGAAAADSMVSPNGTAPVAA